MSITLKKSLDEYIHTIINGINIRTKKETLFIISLRESINSFVNEYPEATMDDIYNRFGTSDEIIEEYLSSLEGVELHKKLSNDLFFKIVVPLIILIIIITSFICIRHIKNYEPPAEVPDTITIYHNYPNPDEGNQ